MYILSNFVKIIVTFVTGISRIYSKENKKYHTYFNSFSISNKISLENITRNKCTVFVNGKPDIRQAEMALDPSIFILVLVNFIFKKHCLVNGLFH